MTNIRKYMLQTLHEIDRARRVARNLFGRFGICLGLIGLSSTLACGEFPDFQASTCGGRCGEGTRCEAGKCIVAMDVAETTSAEQDKPSKSKKKRRRSKRRAANTDDTPSDGQDDVEQDDAPPPMVDDRNVPRFVQKTEVIEMAGGGNEPLSDAEIEQTLKKLDGSFQTCVIDAQKRAGSDKVTGTVSLEFGVAANGHVTGVNATGASEAKKWGLHSCLRRRLFERRFPKFGGNDMSVTTSVAVD